MKRLSSVFSARPKLSKLRSVIYFLFVLLLLSSSIWLQLYLEDPGQITTSTSRPEADNAQLVQIGSQTVLATPTPTPTIIPTHTPAPTQKIIAIVEEDPPLEWGKAVKVGESTWKISVGTDSEMGSPQEIFQALNNYRATKGVSALSWDNGLAGLAQNRASLFSSNNGLDTHAGFNDFMQNQDGFNKIGFYGLGENSAFLGGPLTGVHIIEWIFAGDPDHDGNQLDPTWTHMGAGVSGLGVNINFGKNKR